MKKYVFYRGKKITWLLCVSYLILILQNVIVPHNESARYSETIYSGAVVFTVAFYLLVIAAVIYKSVSVYNIGGSGITYGIIFKKKMFFSRIVEITSSKKYITFTALKNGKRTYLHLNIYILFNNIDLYKDFFAELISKIDVNEISIDKKSKDILSGRRLLTIEDLDTPHPKIGGWLMYFAIVFIVLAFAEILSLMEPIITNSTASDGWDILNAADLINSIVRISFSVIVVILMFKKKRIAPKVLIAREWVTVFFAIAFVVLGLAVKMIGAEKLYWYQYGAYILSISHSILVTLVYIRYYTTSIRVKRTFGLMSDKEYKEKYGDYSAFEDSEGEPDFESVEGPIQEEFGAPELEAAPQKPKRKLEEKDFDIIKEYISGISGDNESNKITFMFFGKVKYCFAKEWYKEMKEALKEDHIEIDKIVASPDYADKEYMEYKPSGEYEKIYFDQMFIGQNTVPFKYLGFLCPHEKSYDYIVDSYCFGEMSWGENLYTEGMKLSFDLKTASRIDLFKHIEIFCKYISLFHIHVFEIDYSKNVKPVKHNGDFVEYNKSKKLILDLEM